MKTFAKIALVVLVLALGISQTYAKDVKTTKIKTSATCGHCKKTIEAAVNELSGVEKCDLDLKTKELSVTYDADKIELKTIKKAISKAGYDADDVKADKKAKRKLPKHDDDDHDHDHENGKK